MKFLPVPPPLLLALFLLILPSAKRQADLPSGTPADLPAITLQASSTPAPHQDSSANVDMILERLREHEAAAHTEMTLMVGTMGAFLVIITLFFAFVGFLGVQNLRDFRKEGREIKKVRGNAQELLEIAQKTVQEAQQASEQILQMRNGLLSAYSALEDVFTKVSSKLLELERSLIGVQQDKPEAPAGATVFEDGDTILLVCDALKLPQDTGRTAEAFTKVGQYWRVVRQFGRAVARLERAAELAPQDANIHRHLGKAWAYWESFEPGPPEIRQVRLSKAIQELELSRNLQESSLVLYDLAWTYDEMREFEKAADLYHQSRDLNLLETRVKREPEDLDITYNLACSLAKADHFDEALLELEKILNKNDNWKSAEIDPDFTRLRSTPPWNERFLKLINDAKPPH
jgi:tetratricopeptide (TPR) repeat protein